MNYTWVQVGQALDKHPAAITSGPEDLGAEEYDYGYRRLLGGDGELDNSFDQGARSQGGRGAPALSSATANAQDRSFHKINRGDVKSETSGTAAEGWRRLLASGRKSNSGVHTRERGSGGGKGRKADVRERRGVGVEFR